MVAPSVSFCRRSATMSVQLIEGECQWTGTVAFPSSAPLTPASPMPNRFSGGLLARAYFANVIRQIPSSRAIALSDNSPFRLAC